MVFDLINALIAKCHFRSPTVNYVPSTRNMAIMTIKKLFFTSSENQLRSARIVTTMQTQAQNFTEQARTTFVAA